jgi:hypothetical protein
MITGRPLTPTSCVASRVTGPFLNQSTQRGKGRQRLVRPSS